jgi:urocanate hydratase
MPQDDGYSEETRRATKQLRAEAARMEAAARDTARETKAAMNEMQETGLSNMQNGMRLQQEMFDTLQDIGREWLARATSGAELAMSLPGKVSAARTPADAFSAYQQWVSEWMNMCGEDSFRAISNGRRIMDTGVRCFTGNSPNVTS